MENKEYLNKIVTVKIDRKLGSKHPKHGFIYPVNYGYIPNTVSGDGEELDCYVLGVFEPIEEYTGKCIAIIHRLNDNDDKLIIVPEGVNYTNEQIDSLVEFQERFFEHEIIRYKFKIDEIKSAQEVYNFIDNNIEYGWLDCNGNKHLNTMKDFRRLYKTLSIDEILSLKIGTCIEQVNLMHYLLDKLNIPNKMFCCRVFEPDDYGNLEEEEHMHCFLLYYENGKVYHMEHPDLERKGIYEYNSETEAINEIVNYYINLRGGKDSPTKEFFEVPVGISFREFNKYINNV